MNKVGLYVHIPFCKRKCAYCDFLSFPFKTPLMENYIEALIKEARRYRVKGKTLYIGGGTPSLVPPIYMESLLAELNLRFGPFAEATLEINPGTVNRDYLELLLKMGIDRISIGIQSFDDSTLHKMGRIHSAKEAIDTVFMAKNVGFNNISIDLIYGYPQTGMEALKRTLEIAITLPVKHISYYGLQLEEGTKLFAKKAKPLSQDEYVEMYLRGSELFEDSRFVQYEVSNFAKKGYQSKHNLLYWKNQPYLGLGLGAVGRLGKIRYRNVVSIDRYLSSIAQGLKVLEIEERITPEVFLEDTIMLGLRLMEGVGPEDLGGKGLDKLYPEAVAFLTETGYLERYPLETSRYRLTRKALPVMNTVLGYLFK